MNKKKAAIYTVLFSIIVIGIAAALAWIKPYGGEVSLLHAISPFFVGVWIVDLIDKFYKWLRK